MKKLSAYLLLLSLVVSFISACGSKNDTTEIPPSPPSTIGAQLRADAGDGQVTLYWPMVATADTYNVYYSTSPTFTKATGTLFESGLPSAPGTVTGLTNGTTYYFAFTAVSTTEGESDLSDIVPAIPSATPPPAAPKNVRANAGDAEVTVTWTPVTAVPAVASYNIHLSCTDGLSYEIGLLTVPGQSTSSKTVNSGITWIIKPSTWADGLENERLCEFNITAETEETGPSTEVSATTGTDSTDTKTDGSVVASLTATSTSGSNQHVSISWVDLPNVHAYTSYNLYYYPDGSDPGSATRISEFRKGNSVTGLTSGTLYHFYLKSTIASSRSFSALATPTANPPPAAPFISTVTAGDGQVYLEWNDVGATSYNVYSSNVMGLSKEVYSGKATGTGIAFTATDLTNDTKYYFVVTAVNANGESTESNEVWAIPSATTPSSGAIVTNNSNSSVENYGTISGYSGTASGESYMSGISSNPSGTLVIYAH